MSIPKGPTEGGSGGKKGHSNAERWGTHQEVKSAARQRRRLESKAIVRCASDDSEDHRMLQAGYREVLGSDVPNDGMYIELHDRADRIVAVVFRSDSSGEFEIQIARVDAPQDLISEFVERAKQRLVDRAAVELGTGADFGPPR